MKKATNKYLSMILTIMVLITGATFDVSFLTASASEGEPDTSWYCDAIALDSSETEFEISTPDQLAGLAEIVNGGADDFHGKTITLTADINLSAYGANWNNEEGWMPIGVFHYTDELSFKGVFNGNYKVISELHINGSVNQYQFVGLFGIVSGGTVKNLAVTGANVTALYKVGCIVGGLYNNAYMENCYSIGTVNGDNGVGGIVGYLADSNLTNCYSTCNVNGFIDVGGISGYVLRSELTNCYSTGIVNGHSIAGGVAASLTGGKIENCVAFNPIILCTDDFFYVGRVTTIPSEYGILSNNYALASMTITVHDEPKTLDISHDKCDGADISMAIAKTASFWTNTMGWDEEVWSFVDGRLPTLKNVGDLQTMPDISWYNETDIEFPIATADQLAGLAQLVNNGTDSFYGKTITLINDIDLSDYGKRWNDGKGWIPIGHATFNVSFFKGHFDGNGKAITRLYINNPVDYMNFPIYYGYDATGLFGWVVGGSVTSLSVVDTDITGGKSTGGVAGYVQEGSVTTCYVTGKVVGTNDVGGIVGRIYNSDVKNCYSAAAISGQKDVGGRSNAGGVVGFAGSIYVLSGNTEIANCYATGAVNGTQGIGGVVGSVVSQQSINYPNISVEIVNCVALNPLVRGYHVGDYPYVGRVTGDNLNGMLSGNMAYIGILGGSWDNINANDLDGEDISKTTALTSSFWTDTMGWDEEVWGIANGRLPILKNVGGLQTTGIISVVPDAKNTKVTVSLIAPWQSDAVLIAALYNGGKLLNLKSEPIIQGGDMTINIDIEAEADTIKAMMWSRIETMQSLCATKTLIKDNGKWVR